MMESLKQFLPFCLMLGLSSSKPTLNSARVIEAVIIAVVAGILAGYVAVVKMEVRMDVLEEKVDRIYADIYRPHIDP